ncbi:glutamate receptor-like isoform X2 [Paramacrobiotus metropolitanus]|uniref:glutamate receptor-like isoform X2 n=1 Tax=Paramacrobiotus metropolitanus TaxID=2943436 RepID=UPI002446346E|nr:glutamate receptor-like isoform X2 [Paramacrobiotus metropolitanus]
MLIRCIITLSLCLIWCWNHGHGERISIFTEKNQVSKIASVSAKIHQKTLKSDLQIDVSPFSDSDLFYNAHAVCKAFRNGTLALIGLADAESSNQLRWYSRALHIPSVIRSSHTQISYADTLADPPHGSYHFDIHPQTIFAVLDIISHGYNWTEAFYITDTNTKSDQAWEVYVKHAKANSNPSRLYATFYQIHSVAHAVDYITSTVLRVPIQPWHMILDLPAQMSVRLINEFLNSIAVRERYFHFILVSLDFEVANFQTLYSTYNNLTALSMIQDAETQKTIRGSNIATTEDALAFDAISFVATALSANASLLPSRSINCTATPFDVWENGDATRQLLQNYQYTGLTGKLEFDKFGNRKNYKLDIMEMNKGGRFVKKGIWSDVSGTQFQNSKDESDNLPLRVIGITAPRFLMTVPCNSTEYENKTPTPSHPAECFVGYIADFVRELGAVTNLSLKLHTGKTKSYYGSKINGSWTGAIGEILRKEADLAIGDLSVTSDRAAVVDFTIPFLHDDYLVLMKKEQQEPQDIFSFLLPFSRNLWLAIILAILGTYVVIFFVGRIGPSEWHHAEHPDPDEAEGVTNEFTSEESLWFTLATLLQQGPNIGPRSMATKIAVAAWFVWVLIISQTYTANLAAFLTINRLTSPIQSIRDLAIQTDIRYGTLTGDHAAANFFANSDVDTYIRMRIFMIQYNTAVKNVQEGVTKVREGNFAFISQKTVIDYANSGPPCDTRIVGLPLFATDYAIAVRSGSPLRKKFSEAILKLNENGILREIEATWFSQQDCKAINREEEKEAKELNRLTPRQLTGLFIILAGGLAIALVFAICQNLCCHKKFRAYKISMQTVLLTERRTGTSEELRKTILRRTTRQRPSDATSMEMPVLRPD